MDGLTNLQAARRRVAARVNAEHALLWRWFSGLLEERRIRCCRANDKWIISVDHRHPATSSSFDSAVREAQMRTAVLAGTNAFDSAGTR